MPFEFSVTQTQDIRHSYSEIRTPSRANIKLTDTLAIYAFFPCQTVFKSGRAGNPDRVDAA
jgi:hypothetical protein